MIGPARATALAGAGAVLSLCALPAVGQQEIHVVTGPVPEGEFGRTLAALGDVDGDLYADFVVGGQGGFGVLIPYAPGSVSVVSGRTGTLLWSIEDPTVNGYFGAFVANAGDVNGDGMTDVIASGLGSGGFVRVYSALDGTLLLSLDSTPTLTIGSVVAGAGDVNLDGRADLLVGAPGADPDAASPNGGIARVFSGADGSVLFSYTGAAHDFLGESVDGVGDLNHDGHADFMVGVPRDAFQHEGVGSAHVFSGLDGSELFGFSAGGLKAGFGRSVAGAGDVDADGWPDLIIAAMQEATGPASEGRVRVYSGRAGALLHTFDCDQTWTHYGEDVSGAGDVNDDGHDDVIVGAWRYHVQPPSTSHHGRVFIYSGLDGSLLKHFDGPESGKLFAGAVDGAGDVNRDGHDDVLIGAYLMVSKGQVFVESLTCGQIVTIGEGCPGSGGFTPELSLEGCAMPGGTLTLHLNGALGGASALLALGPPAAPHGLPGGCTSWVGFPAALVPVALGGIGPGAGTAALTGKLPMGIPAGLTVAIQAFVLDPAPGAGLASSNAVDVTIL